MLPKYARSPQFFLSDGLLLPGDLYSHVRLVIAKLAAAVAQQAPGGTSGGEAISTTSDVNPQPDEQSVFYLAAADGCFVTVSTCDNGQAIRCSRHQVEGPSSNSPAWTLVPSDSVAMSNLPRASRILCCRTVVNSSTGLHEAVAVASSSSCVEVLLIGTGAQITCERVLAILSLPSGSPRKAWLFDGPTIVLQPQSSTLLVATAQANKQTHGHDAFEVPWKLYSLAFEGDTVQDVVDCCHAADSLRLVVATSSNAATSQEGGALLSQYRLNSQFSSWTRECCTRMLAKATASCTFKAGLLLRCADGGHAAGQPGCIPAAPLTTLSAAIPQKSADQVRISHAAFDEHAEGGYNLGCHALLNNCHHCLGWPR